MAITAAMVKELREMTGAGTVSYTHLDVYKRQVSHRWRIVLPLPHRIFPTWKMMTAEAIRILTA